MNVGVVTYVHGWYVDYIPFFIYSISKVYPDYEIRVFLRETLPDHTRFNLSLLDGANFKVIEGYLADVGCRNDKSKKPYYLRWLIPHYSISDLDTAFICDVDLLMLKESTPLADFRSAICDKLGLPFANYIREPHPDYPPRITGWHFIKVKEYYDVVGEIIDSYRDSDVDITELKNRYYYKNGLGEIQWGQESLLYEIIMEGFGDVDLEIKFPTHHGIHLGPLRANLHRRLYNREPEIIDRFGYNERYWYDPQAFELANDPMINKMLDNLPNGNVKTVITRFVNDLGHAYI